MLWDLQVEMISPINYPLKAVLVTPCFPKLKLTCFAQAVAIDLIDSEWNVPMQMFKVQVLSSPEIKQSDLKSLVSDPNQVKKLFKRSTTNLFQLNLTRFGSTQCESASLLVHVLIWSATCSGAWRLAGNAGFAGQGCGRAGVHLFEPGST